MCWTRIPDETVITTPVVNENAPDGNGRNGLFICEKTKQRLVKHKAINTVLPSKSFKLQRWHVFFTISEDILFRKPSLTKYIKDTIVSHFLNN